MKKPYEFKTLRWQTLAFTAKRKEALQKARDEDHRYFIGIAERSHAKEALTDQDKFALCLAQGIETNPIHMPECRIYQHMTGPIDVEKVGARWMIIEEPRARA